MAGKKRKLPPPKDGQVKKKRHVGHSSDAQEIKKQKVAKVDSNALEKKQFGKPSCVLHKSTHGKQKLTDRQRKGGQGADRSTHSDNKSHKSDKSSHIPVTALKKKKGIQDGKKKAKQEATNCSPIELESESVDQEILLPKKSEDISANWKLLRKSFKKKHPHSHRHKQHTYKRCTKKTDTQEIIEEKKQEPEPEIWFDDVDEVLLESSKNKSNQQVTKTELWDTNRNPLVKEHSYNGVTKIIAMDCEMVGVGPDGEHSILARISIVNAHGQCVYDKFVRATEKVTDYRTQFSGIRPGDLAKGEDFRLVQKEVCDLIKGRILVGHAIHNDLKVLFIDHPGKQVRDTSRYKPFRALFQGRTPSLKKLSEQVIGVKVQEGEHNSIQDAQATMRLYTMHRQLWEKQLKMKRKIGQMKKVNEKKADSS